MSNSLGKEYRMTYDEITLFRRFMGDKGTLNNFEYFYSKHRFQPVSIDAYYEQTQAEDVILNAFDMSAGGNSIFNWQYWKKLDERWQRRLQEFRDTGKINEEATIKCSQCKRILPKSAFLLRSNGLLHKHCKECESGEYARRMKEKKKAEEELIAEKRRSDEFARARQKEIECSLDYAAKVDARLEKESESREPITTNLTEKKVEDFTFFDFEKKSSLANSIGPNKFAINNKRGNYTVVMNIEDSKAIIDAGLMRLRLRQDNITGAMHFVFNATVGAACCIKNKRNVAVSNKDLVEFLIKSLGYDKATERVLVDISDNLSRTRDYVTFLIKKPRK